MNPVELFPSARAVCLGAFTALVSASVAHPQATPPKPQSTIALTCPVRTTPPTDADIAYATGKEDQAADLYLKESKAPGPEGERAHNGYIRTLLQEAKVDDAEKEARAWVAASPDSSWAYISLAEVQFRQGRLDELIPSIQTAGRLDRCNMEVHVLFARFSEATGMFATAKKHLDLAHIYDPLNDEIEDLWLPLQPRAIQLDELTKYLDRSKYLTDDERKSLTERKTRFEHPAQPCRLAESVTSTTIPLHAIPYDVNGPVEWGLIVSIDGKDRRLELDTGASGLALFRSAAAALHLTPEFEGHASGIGDQGSVKAFAAKVNSIKIGNLEFHNCYVDVLETDPPLGNADGLIGANVFRDFLVTIDYPGSKVQLGPLPAIPGSATPDALQTSADTGDRPPQDAYIAPEMQNWTAVLRVGHMILMPTSINKGLPHLFLVDTGAGIASISPAAAREVGKIGRVGAVICGISGCVQNVYSADQLTLHFAGLGFPTNGLLTFDNNRLSTDTGIEVSGFLGAGILRRLTIQLDYRDDLVKFNYDPSRLHPCMPGIYREDCYPQ